MNKYIINANCTGKTRKMLETAKESGATIICKHPFHMQDKANAYGLYGLEFISYEEFDANGCENKKIAIDEIGEFIKHCWGVELDSFTMTVDDKEA